MAKVKITGHASGSGVITVTAPNTSTDRTITLPDATCTLADNSDVTTKLPLAGGILTGDLDISDTGVGALTVGGTTNAYSAPVLFNVTDLGLDVTDGTKHLASWANHGGSSHTGSAIGTRSNHDLALVTNDTKAVFIDTAGIVTMPLQPAFQAKPSTDQNNIAEGADVTIIYGTEVLDQNSDFNSNVFTAPVTGKYQLNSYIRLNNVDTAPAYYQFKIKTSNRTYTTTYDTRGFSEDPAYYSFSHSALADMDAGDTAYVAIHQHSAGTAQTDVDPETTFSGYLAC